MSTTTTTDHRAEARRTEQRKAYVEALLNDPRSTDPQVRDIRALFAAPLPLHRTEAGYPYCSTCDGGGCYDCTDPA